MIDNHENAIGPIGEYVSKSYDRALNRKKASGYTIWGLVVIGGALFGKFAQNLPAILNDRDGLLIIARELSILFFFAFSCWSFFVDLVRWSSPPSSEDRVIGKVTFISSQIVGAYMLVILTIFALLNYMVILFSSQSALGELPYIILFIYSLLGCIGVCLVHIGRRHKKTKQIFPLLLAKPKRYSKVISHVVDVVILVASLWAMWDLRHMLRSENGINGITSALYLIGIILVGAIISREIASNIRNEWLQDLERRIVFEKLGDEEIKQIYYENIIGGTCRDFLGSISAELAASREKYDIACRQALEKTGEITKIPKQFALEIHGKSDEVLRGYNCALKDYTDCLVEAIDKVKQILILSNVTPPEKDVLRGLVETVGSDLRIVKEASQNVRRGICQHCDQSNTCEQAIT